MKFHLFHKWIYSERIEVVGQIHPEYQAVIFERRVCSNCGKIQFNDGKFLYDSFGYEFKKKWVTTGYRKDEVK